MTTAEITFYPIRCQDLSKWIRSIRPQPERVAVPALVAPEHVRASLAEFGFVAEAE